ncbi:hypothetical protein EMIHUDRAFT_201591 [Emiliania huxleyi CCMP1516]|uniref:Cysteine protease n=2 Tax=Emiliania huxleyi TaxID=2903 RepID=A0A0D3KI89_EMIH1|nr:hypothetical protein EMIHUDRAFT_201591 [Emiliania huxleyi CCMP1516]EOD35474.1 hypothetical protein EMIHUDRAFT_201591 [Emiliania huxleyi CCMP1516]|eukprot:XP_005787903.1 hypothetical protein EMIHUDRAFT_201591 [Emiliania huxleyi CCMP1516]
MLESSTVVWLRSAAREASYRLARFLPESSDAVQPDSPIHILGTVVEASAEATAEVQACVRACLWFTYRQHFEPIPGTAATVALFADCLAAPYSLHRITLEGQAQGLPVGRWMGPASIAQVLVVAAASGGGGGWRPLLLLVPLRLGLDRLNAEYVPTILGLLRLPQCVGVIGGRPRSSYYFIGSQGEPARRLLYLDPHEVQPALRPDDPDVASCHYGRGLRSVRVGDIDPSLAFGFLCGSADEFDELCAGCARVGSSSLSAFSIAEARVLCYERAGSEAEEAEPLSSDDDDDLVVL